MLVLTVTSCSVDGVEPQEVAILPVNNVVMPTKFKVDSVSVITVMYRRPTDCYIFNGIYYTVDGNIRTVTVNAILLNQLNCQNDSETLFEVPMNFRPTNAGPHIFKFWIGDNPNGVEQYLSYNVDVNP